MTVTVGWYNMEWQWLLQVEHGLTTCLVLPLQPQHMPHKRKTENLLVLNYLPYIRVQKQHNDLFHCMVPNAAAPLTEGADFQEQLNQHKKWIKDNQDNHKEVKPGTVEGHLHATTPATGTGQADNSGCSHSGGFEGHSTLWLP